MRIVPRWLTRLNIHWNFVAGASLLIVYLLVGAADFLQGGYLWPLCLGAAIAQGVVLWRGGDVCAMRIFRSK